MTHVVRLELLHHEAERLYASAALYESTIHRIVRVAETDQVAASALTKLAQAIHAPELAAEPWQADPGRPITCGPISREIDLGDPLDGSTTLILRGGRYTATRIDTVDPVGTGEGFRARLELTPSIS